MITTERSRAVTGRILFVTLLGCLWSGSVAAQLVTKAVFWKESEIYTVRSDGTQLKRLTNDQEVKMNPQWSPDGTKIAYETRGDEKTVAKFVVLDESGRVHARVPVLSTALDGTPRASMRGVDK